MGRLYEPVLCDVMLRCNVVYGECSVDSTR